MKTKSKWATIVITFIVLGVGYKAFTSARFKRWITTPSRHDLVETSSGNFNRFGATPEELGLNSTSSIVSTNSVSPASMREAMRIRTGTEQINNRNWFAIVNNDDRMRVDVKMLSENTYWEVRLDRDDRRYHKMYPRGWRPGSHTEITNDFTVMEVRVFAGQTTNQAEIAWSVTPK